MKYFATAFIAPFLNGPAVERQQSSRDFCVCHLMMEGAHNQGSIVTLMEHVSSSYMHAPSYTAKYSTERHASGSLAKGVREWLVPSANAAIEGPTNEQIDLLRRAFAALYNEGGSPEVALPLLNDVVEAWAKQPADERAGLYRVRGDCHLRLLQMKDAVKDYTTAIELLDGPDGDLADPSERPAARLGRARAIMSVKGDNKLPVDKVSAKMAVDDYTLALKLSSREEWDTDEENITDGAQRNPYAAWERGSAMRAAGEFADAYKAHSLASESFENIGDHARAVISSLDAGIDLAATGDVALTKRFLEPAIRSSIGVESRDVELLERVVSKEGEARIALASILWDNNEKQQAESYLGEVSNIHALLRDKLIV